MDEDVETCEHSIPLNERCEKCDWWEYGDMQYDEDRISDLEQSQGKQV